MYKVETYFEEHNRDLVTESESLEEWNNLIKTLELSGQENLSTNDKSPIPYAYINKSQKRIYETIPI